MLSLQLLILLLATNGSPVLLRLLPFARLRRPLDGGRRLADGRPLFGPSKTVAGLLVAVAVATALAGWFGLGWQAGLVIGALSMLGDLLSSFVKRRRGIPPGAMALGLDQLPEALLPLLACTVLLDLGIIAAVAVSVAFMAANLAISRLLYHLGMRHHPH